MKRKILIQFDSDPHASTFDAIVAIDSGIDQLISHSNVSAVEIQSLVHGAMFTRGPDDLKHTALFFGGSDVAQSESLVRAAKNSFFGPVRTSLMADPNGSNTTAAAAVLSAQKHFELKDRQVTVLAATGPVGLRVVELVARLGASVRICSRRLARAKAVAAQLTERFPDIQASLMVPYETGTRDETLASLSDSDVVFSAGAAGIQMLDERWRGVNPGPSVAIDLNAVPPAGIPSIDVIDRATEREGVIGYGAVGVGGLKMKIHRACIAELFKTNDRVLELQEIYQVGRQLGESR